MDERQQHTNDYFSRVWRGQLHAATASATQPNLDLEWHIAPWESVMAFWAEIFTNRQPSRIETRDAGRLRAMSPFLQLNSDLSLAAISLFRKAQGVLECQLRGGSMGRAIPAGARIRIRCMDPESSHTGQVIAFLVGSGICVHRIVYRGRWRRTKNYLITQGDHCLLPDGPVKLESVLGPVTECEHEGRWEPPGTPQRRKPVTRLVAFVVLTTLAGVLEINVKLAQWLAVQLWRAERAAVRVRARLRCRGTRSAGWTDP